MNDLFDLLGGQFPGLLAVSFLVGIVVGRTGMGGASSRPDESCTI